MKQKITNFHRDSESHWVADLECGHAQHVRHDPPWTEREWVLTEEGRASRLGLELNCVRCDEMALAIAKAVQGICIETLKNSYEQAGISGLCGEGRWEVALSTLQSIDIKQLASDALSIRP